LFFFQVGPVALAAVVTVERIESAVEALEAPSVAEVGASDSEVAGLDESLAVWPSMWKVPSF